MSGHRIEVTSMGDHLLRAADRWPDNDAIIFPEIRYTYAELVDRAYARARALIAIGVGRGKNIGALMPNCMEYVELIWGAALIGATIVPINARFKGQELAYVIKDADLTALFTTDIISEYADFAGLLSRTFDDLGSADPKALSLARAPLLRNIVMMGASSPAGFLTRAEFDALEGDATNEQVEERRIFVRLSDPCIMMYTSGTTSNPKGCPLSHEMLVRTGMAVNRENYELDTESRFWDPLPLFHMSSILPMIALFDAGGTMLSMTHFEAGQALEMMETERVTHAFPAFPALTIELINHPDFKKRDLSRIIRMNNVGPPDLLRQFEEAFPHAKQTAAYGLTEVTGVICFGHPDDPLEERIHACGKPWAGVEVCVVDPETGEEMPRGQRGEIKIRGYAVFDGYYKAPEKNAEAFKDGWFYSGDLCEIDEAGQIRFHGRLKDMLKIGGENVAALEIESYLSNMSEIAMVQIIGVPDDRLQEVAAAFIELKPGESLTEEAVIDFCKGEIASFKVPRYVRFVSEWPVSSTKVQKFKLREMFDQEVAAE